MRRTVLTVVGILAAFAIGYMIAGRQLPVFNSIPTQTAG